MTDDAVSFRTACRCGDAHLTVAYTTTTPGLYVNEADYCPTTRKRVRGQRWAVTHRPTGLAFPWRFSGPEPAFWLAEYAASLTLDWTVLNPSITDDIRLALTRKARSMGAKAVGPHNPDWRPPVTREEVNR